MSNEISNNNILRDSVSRNSVFQKDGFKNGILGVQVKQREYYEEFIERKRHEQHKNLTKKFQIAQKKQKRYQKQIDQILKVNKKNTTGPRWFQEISNKQLDILHTFGDRLKDDYNLNMSKNTRRALRSLGVATYIPHDVAMEALYSSELHTVIYLTEIKNYLTQNGKTRHDHTHITHKHDNNPSLDIRILMSSIVNLEFKNLVTKLNYCLSEPKPDKKLKFIKIPKSKRKPLNYFSPYLEPLPEPTISWDETEKIKTHNIKVKKQKIHENMKYKTEHQNREMELKKMKNIESKMKVKYPEHPLEKMFYNPPIVQDFNSSKILPQKNNLHSTTSYITEEMTNMSNESMSSTQSLLSNSTEKVIEKRDTVVDEKLPSSKSSLPIELPVVDEKVYERKPILAISQLPVSSSSSVSIHGVDVYNPSMNSIYLSSYEASVDNVSKESAKNTLLNFTYNNSISTYDSESNCGTITTRDDTNMTLPEVKSAELKKNVDESSSLDILQTIQLSKITSAEIDVLRNLRKPGHIKRSKQKPATRISKFSVDDMVDTNLNTDVTEKILETVTNNIELETSSLRQDQNKKQERDGEVLRGTLPKSEFGGDVKTIPLNRKQSLANFFPDKDGGETVARISSSSSKFDQDKLVTEPSTQGDFKDESIDLDRVLSVLRQLPPLKQLQAVLNLLSLLGDPIAGYPELIELKMLRKWYERRLNINRHITSKMKKSLMNKSIAAWNSPKTKLSDVPILKNPMQLDHNAKKITWDHVNHIKKTFEKTKADYTIKLKHVAINNARQMYPSMENDNYKNRLCQNFKQTFFNYFPAKESDCLFGNPLTSYNIHKTKSKGTKE